MSKLFTLSKQERLKSRKQIEQLFQAGARISVPLFRVSYLYGGAGDEVLLFGTGASSRHFKRAVDRNRIKRLTREAWRLQKNELKEKLQQQGHSLHIFFIYTGKEIPVYADVYAAVGKVIQKLVQAK
ncbi:MAG TPA: ribonuclease P protein component [Chitinophagaceae bacterium]|nr:ribonuclease P protein component [Chitinophagaceae bacterium]